MPPERCPCGRSGPLFVSEEAFGIIVFRHSGPGRHHMWVRDWVDGREKWRMNPWPGSASEATVPLYAPRSPPMPNKTETALRGRGSPYERCPCGKMGYLVSVDVIGDLVVFFHRDEERDFRCRVRAGGIERVPVWPAQNVGLADA